MTIDNSYSIVKWVVSEMTILVFSIFLYDLRKRSSCQVFKLNKYGKLISIFTCAALYYGIVLLNIKLLSLLQH